MGWNTSNPQIISIIIISILASLGFFCYGVFVVAMFFMMVVFMVLVLLFLLSWWWCGVIGNDNIFILEFFIFNIMIILD